MAGTLLEVELDSHGSEEEGNEEGQADAGNQRGAVEEVQGWLECRSGGVGRPDRRCVGEGKTRPPGTR